MADCSALQLKSRKFASSVIDGDLAQRRSKTKTKLKVLPCSLRSFVFIIFNLANYSKQQFRSRKFTVLVQKKDLAYWRSKRKTERKVLPCILCICVCITLDLANYSTPQFKFRSFASSITCLLHFLSSSSFSYFVLIVSSLFFSTGSIAIILPFPDSFCHIRGPAFETMMRI